MQSFRVKVTRSENMARIKSKNTKPELVLRQRLHAQGLRYRIHVKELPGNPDLVFPRKRVAVFVHGCFWHAHNNCKQASKPKSNSEYWQEKLRSNVERDQIQGKALECAGYRVVTVWECEIERDIDRAVSTIIPYVI